MVIYVDGPDLLACFAGREDPIYVHGQRERSRENLANWLGRYCEARDCRAVLVFDDNEPNEKVSPSERHGLVRIVNLPFGGEALREIGGPANRSASEERTLVVTDDFRLLQAVERGKATGLSCPAFLARVRKAMRKDDEATPDEPDEKFSGISDQEVGFWVEYFRGDAD
jgi:hypothetical protein